MTLYSFALFVHIIGSLMLFTAFTAEGIGLFHLRRVTTTAQVREWESVAGLARIFGPASVVAILIPGLYMMVTSWGWVPWLAAGLFAWFLIALMGAVNGIRLSADVRKARADVAMVSCLGARAYVVSWFIRLALATGIVFLMTDKPGLAWALLCLAIAAAIGLTSGVLASRKAVGRLEAVVRKGTGV